MRKFKKFAATLLGAAMALSMATLTAFASPTDPATTPATIDGTKVGSLSVHKYEYNGDAGLTNGTGTKADEANLPKNEDGALAAKPLAGAEFSIYKITDLDEMKTYYSTNPADLPDWSDYVTQNDAAAQESTGIKYTAKTNLTKTATQTTNDNGTATFSDLALGFYLVLETAVPDSVSAPVQPFIVSVPMTTKDGDNWLYDVHVYPKNETTYGKVDLVKEGVESAKLSGINFKLEKQGKDADGKETWTKITKQATAQGDNTGTDLNLKTDADGKITVEGLSKGTYRFVEVSSDKNEGYIVDSSAQYIFTVSRLGVVAWVDSSDASGAFTPAKTEDGTTTTAQITVTNYKTDLDKEIKDKDGNWSTTNDADYSVGDMVPYKITVDVPKNVARLGKFVVTDTPTNLVDNIQVASTATEDSYKLRVLDKNGAMVAGALWENGVERLGTGGFTMTFATGADTTESWAEYAGEQITIEYYAELQSTAVVTNAGNPNTAKLEYTNKIKEDGTPDTSTNTIEDEAVVYTFQLTVHKTGEDGAYLKDVLFDLYKEVPAGTVGAVQAADLPSGLDAAKTWKKINTTPLTTDGNGLVYQGGLANGTYYLVETKTNAEYNLLKDPVEVTLNIQYTTGWKTTVDIDKDGNVTKHVMTTITEFKGTDVVTKTTMDGKTEVTITNNQNLKDNDTEGTEAVTVVNKKGFELPLTGGMGTIIFTFGGIALALAGFMIIMASRKKTA